VVYIDGSFVKHNIPVKPIYITLRNLTTAVSGKAAAWLVLGMIQQSLTSTATTRIHVSRQDLQTQQRRMAGVAATSMRSTRGCGSLDVVSLA
jgi:hypothetical protein